MASSQRHKDGDWLLPTTADGRIESWQAVQIAVLMDLRDELKKLNSLLHCDNFRQVPALLRLIRANTAKPRKKKRRAV